MRRRISSSLTIFNKIFVLVLFAVIVPIWLVQNNDSPTELFFILLFVVLFGFFMLNRALSLKHVEMTDDGLVISTANFFSEKEIFVHYENILEARQAFWQRGNYEIVVVEFHNRTKFGKKITFAPKYRYYAMAEHPIVNEINSRATGIKIY
jgi:hypothetical protein